MVAVTSSVPASKSIEGAELAGPQVVGRHELDRGLAPRAAAPTTSGPPSFPYAASTAEPA